MVIPKSTSDQYNTGSITLRYDNDAIRIEEELHVRGKEAIQPRRDEGHHLRYPPPEPENQPRLRWGSTLRSRMRGVLLNRPPPRGRPAIVSTG
jgi:hypothetical protein